MVWLFVVGLGVWGFFQNGRISGLERRVDALVLELSRLRSAQAEDPVRAPEPTSIPETETPPEVRTEPTPEPLGEPVAEDGPGLVAALAARVRELAAADAIEAAQAPVPTAPRAPRRSLAAWLSENGLAWLGGGGLALGGLFMVTYAAQRGVFTPALRIIAALVLGAVMLAVSEWIRRLERRDGRGHALAAAATAGAGAATLYGAVWAAERLYHFIGLGIAAPALILISAGLLGLALLHGAPLALLALGGAFLAPLVTGQAEWSDLQLTLYLALITVTAYGAAALRRWGSVALAAGLAAAIWAVAEGQALRGATALALLLLPPLLASLAVAWRQPAVGSPLRLAPAVAVVVSSLLSLYGWVLATEALQTSPAMATTLNVGLVLIAGAAARRRLIAPAIQLVAYATAGLGAIFTLGVRLGSPALVEARLGAPLIGLGLAAAGFIATGVHRARSDRLWAASGAVAAGLVFGLAEISFRTLAPAAPWSAPAAGAVLLAACAAWLAGRTDEAERDLPLALWIWSATAIGLQAIGLALEPRVLPAAFAVFAVAATLLQTRLGWRGLGSSALAAALAAFAALLGPDLAGGALAGRLGLVPLMTALAAGLIYGSARIARRAAAPPEFPDALSTAALVTGLAGAFLILRALALASGGGAHLDGLTEAGLRAILLLVPGLLSARAAAEGPIARWRPHVFLGLGVLHTLFVQVLWLDPIWSGRSVAGPPLLDGLAVAYLAPALLLAVASTPRISPDRRFARAYGICALALGLIWAALEIRRLCQGVDLSPGLEPLGRVEGAADAVVALLAAVGLFWRERRREAAGPDPAGPVGMAAAAALIAAGLLFGWAVSPWWGPITRPLSGMGEAALLGLLEAAGVGATLALARLATGRWAAAARVMAALQLFVLVTLTVRFGFRGVAMGPSHGEAGFETWAFSAIWALYGLGVLILGVRRGDGALRWTGLGLLLMTTAKVVAFDMARLDGLVRAASFLAVGALLLAGALAARRMGAFGKSGD